MELDKRVSVFVAFVFVSSITVELLDLPIWIFTLGTDLLVSFVISGLFYGLLKAAGLDFLEEIQLWYPLSAMTVAVFLLRHLLI